MTTYNMLEIKGISGGGYLRPQKSINLSSLYDGYVDKTGQIGYSIFNNLEIKPIGRIGDGFFKEKDNWILDDCNFVAEKRIVPESEAIREKVVYGGFMRHQWGHFIVNTMSRLWFLFAHKDVEYDKIVFALPPYEPHSLKGNFREFFEKLGIIDKIEFISSPKAYSQVIVPELSWSLQKHWSEEFNLVYDTLIENVINEAPDYNNLSDKIFFTRARLEKSKTCEIGIEFLDEFFEKNGYKVIAPETLTLSQMIQVIQNAKVVAGASGSTVHNILFGRRGQKLIIAERNAINNDFQPGINIARKLDVTYIDTFLTINSVNSGLGPFFYYPTKQLMRFADDNAMAYPDKKFFSEKWLKRNLRAYFKSWDIFYCRQWYFQKDFICEMNGFTEAYYDSFEIVGDYLRGYKPLLFINNQMIRRIVRKFVKNEKIKSFIRKFV